MTFSINNRLIVEAYSQTGLKTEIKNGIATPGQRDAVKPLRVLLGTVLPDGRHVPAGSIAYFREDNLYAQPWTKKTYRCDTLSEPFLIAELVHVEFITTPEPAA